MASEEIVNYLKEGKKRGFSVQLLKQKLLGGGFPEGEIDKAIDSLAFGKKEETAQKHSRPVEGKHLDKSKLGGQDKMPARLGVFRKIGKAIAHPTELFEETKEEGIWSALKYQLVILIVPFVILSILSILFASLIVGMINSYISSLPGANVSGDLSFFLGISPISLIIFFAFAYFILGPIFTFIGAGIQHLIIKLFRGQGKYANTYSVMIYSSTPSMLIGFIPLVGFGASIWSFVLALFGLSIAHKISKLRAFISLIILPLILFIVVFALALLGISSGPALSPPLSGSPIMWIALGVIVVILLIMIILANSGKKKEVVKRKGRVSKKISKKKLKKVKKKKSGKRK